MRMCVVDPESTARDIKAFDGFAFVVYSLEVSLMVMPSRVHSMYPEVRTP